MLAAKRLFQVFLPLPLGRDCDIAKRAAEAGHRNSEADNEVVRLEGKGIRVSGRFPSNLRWRHCAFL